MSERLRLDNRPIKDLLVLKNATYRSNIVRRGRVAIQVIALEVGDDHHARAIMFDRFDLKRIQIQSREIQLAAGLRDIADRLTARSGADRLALCSFKHAGDKLGSGGLAVGAG